MTQRRTKTKIRRLSLQINQQAGENLEWLMEKTGAETMTEVIQRSLSLYHQMVEWKEEGKSLFRRDKDGKETEILLIFF